MSLSLALSLTALAGAIVVLAQRGDRVVALVAIAVAGFEAATAAGLISLRIGGVPLGLILAGVLLACGAILWSRSSGKPAVTGATAIAVVGAVQLLAALHVLR